MFSVNFFLLYVLHAEKYLLRFIPAILVCSTRASKKVDLSLFFGRGDKRHEMGEKRWEKGDGRKEMGDGRWEIRDGRQEMGDRRWEIGDGRQEMEDRR